MADLFSEAIPRLKSELPFGNLLSQVASVDLPIGESRAIRKLPNYFLLADHTEVIPSGSESQMPVGPLQKELFYNHRRSDVGATVSDAIR